MAHLLLERAGIPMPDLFCYYDPLSKTENNTTAYNHDSVLRILKDKNVKACIIKTTETSHGEGVVLIKRIDYENSGCQLYGFNGQVIEISQILKNDPLIFEGIVEQTDQFKEFNFSSVNTIRFMTLLLPDGEAEIIAAFLKTGRKGAFVDNAGSGGNIDAAIDIETGEIHSAIQFNGWRKISPITNHPDTGAQLNGVTIENWTEIKYRILRFQQAMPFLKAIGWDIAITDKGPLVIEINDFWDETGQLFIGKGWKPEIESGHNEWIKYLKKQNV